MTSRFPKNVLAENDGNIGEALEQEDKLCHDTETVKEFIYLGDWLCTGGG